jgi:hypothetical protein
VGTGGEDHSYWGGAELLDTLRDYGVTRSTFYVDADHPGSDVPAGMASAMAASSVAFRQHGSSLVGQNGFENGLSYGGSTYTTGQ